MIQAKIESFSIPKVVDTSGNVRSIDIKDYRNKYVVFLTFTAAFHDISTFELIEFSKAAKSFKNENAVLLAICRETTNAIQDWMANIPVVFPREKARFDIVSDLTAKGLISKLEGTAVIGYPGPMTCILDKTGSVRHVTEVSSIIGRSVDETLRIVQALKLVDEYGGSALAPGDWRVGEPYIWNTRPGVDTFYAERAGLKSNVLSKILRMVQSFFTRNEEEVTTSESNKSMKELQFNSDSSGLEFEYGSGSDYSSSYFSSGDELKSQYDYFSGTSSDYLVDSTSESGSNFENGSTSTYYSNSFSSSPRSSSYYTTDTLSVDNPNTSKP